MSNYRLASLILRLGLAVVFLYAAIASFFDPKDWVGYFPQFLLANLPQNVLLTGFSVIEIILAGWLLSGWRMKWAAIASTLALGGIVIFNIGALEIIFRDFGLIAAALALFYLSSEE